MQIGIGMGLGLTPAGGAAGGAVAYLPTTPAPLAAGGSARLFSEYTGPAIKLVRSSDAGTLDLAAMPGNVNMSGYDAFAGAATTTAERFYDQAYVINGGAAGVNDVVAETPSAGPIFRKANAINGKQPVSMSCTPAGNFSSGRAMKNAVTVTDKSNVTFFYVGALAGGTVDTLAPWCVGTEATAANYLGPAYNTFNQMAAFYPFGYYDDNTIGGPQSGQLAVFCHTSGPSGQSLRINGVERWQTSTPIASSTLTGFLLGRHGWTGAPFGPADVTGYALYSGLTLSQIQAREAALGAIFNVPIGVQSRLLSYEGDSIPAGMNNGMFYRGYARQLNDAWLAEGKTLPNTPNFCGGTGTAVQMYGTRDTTWKYSSNKGATTLRHLFSAGTNDIEFATSGNIVGIGSTVWNTGIKPYLQSMLDPARFGPNNVAVGTLIPRGWTGSNTDQTQKAAEAEALNQLIRDEAPGLGARVVDFGGIVALRGTPTAGNPRPPNYTYYSDAAHPNEAGHALMLAVWKPVADAMMYP